MPARKVYQTHIGFYDEVVAAYSQASALAAFGSGQNLFRLGLARVTGDPAAVKAAMAKPGRVLRRPAGSNLPFSENPPLPKIPATRKASARSAKASSNAHK